MYVFAEVSELRHLKGSPAVVTLVSFADDRQQWGRGEGLVVVRGVECSFVTTDIGGLEESPVGGVRCEEQGFWPVDEGVCADDGAVPGHRVLSTDAKLLHRARRVILEHNADAKFYSMNLSPAEVTAAWQRDRGLLPYSWWWVPDQALVADARQRLSTCRLEWEVRGGGAPGTGLRPATADETLDLAAPPSILVSLDIETKYPTDPGYVFSIACAYYLADGASDREPIETLVYLTEDGDAGGRAQDHLAEVAQARASDGRFAVSMTLKSFGTERAMFESVYTDMRARNVSFVVGYNHLDFDIMMMVKQVDPNTGRPDADTPRYPDLPAFPLSRLKNENVGLTLDRGRSIMLAFGELPTFRFQGCFGTVFLDLLLWLRRTDQIKPEAGLSLRAVSEYNNLSFSKDDIPYTQLSYFYGEARFRAKVAYYVALDAILAATNVFVLNLVGIVRANSSQLGEHPHTLTNRGLAVISHALISSYGRRSGALPFLARWHPPSWTSDA